MSNPRPLRIPMPTFDAEPPCWRCNGIGSLALRQPDASGVIRTRDCPECDGMGVVTRVGSATGKGEGL